MVHRGQLALYHQSPYDHRSTVYRASNPLPLLPPSQNTHISIPQRGCGLLAIVIAVDLHRAVVPADDQLSHTVPSHVEMVHAHHPGPARVLGWLHSPLGSRLVPDWEVGTVVRMPSRLGRSCEEIGGEKQTRQSDRLPSLSQTSIFTSHATLYQDPA